MPTFPTIDPKKEIVSFDGKECSMPGLAFAFVSALIDSARTRSEDPYVSNERLAALTWGLDPKKDQQKIRDRARNNLKQVANNVRNCLAAAGMMEIKIDGKSRPHNYAISLLAEGCDSISKRRTAEEWARQYARDNRRDGVMFSFVRQYADLFMQNRPPDARELADMFARALKKCKSLTIAPHHTLVLELLKKGMPESPVHVPLCAFHRNDFEQLLRVPHYAAVLLVLRLMKEDYGRALKMARDVVNAHQYHHALVDCALLHYVQAQCHRKLGRGHYPEALAMHNEAANRLSCWKTTEGCPCGANCSRNGLLAEVHRGLAALYRGNGKFDQAAKELTKGARYLSAADVHDGIRADYNYTHGYFHLEVAAQLLEKQGWHRDSAASNHLSKAKALFSKSHKQLDSWSAPLSRLAMSEQLLGEDHEGFNMHYVFAYTKATMERDNVEGILTGINARFAVLVDDYFSKLNEPRSFNPQDVRRDLLLLFNGDKHVAAGPRQCHAFDNRVILQGRQLPADSALLHVHEFLQIVAEHNGEALQAQHALVHEFCRSKGVSVAI
jgi:hypothetical protein